MMDVCAIYYELITNKLFIYYVKYSLLGRSDHTKSSFQKFAVCVFTVLGEFMYGW